TLEAWQRDIMNARLVVCSLVDRLVEGMGLTHDRPAIEALLGAAGNGSLPPATIEVMRTANARAGQTRSLPHPATIYRWLKRRVEGPAALAPVPSRRKASTPVWANHLLRIYQVPSKPSVLACLRDWTKAYPDMPVPPQRTAQRWMKSLPP